MAKSIISYPFDSEGFDLARFKEHYKDNLGLDIKPKEIREHVYGGRKLNKLYETIEIRATEEQLKAVHGDILLTSRKKGLDNIEILDVSLRQFLIAGLPYLQCGTSDGCPTTGDWQGGDRWPELHEQYRLELCHSEISRWSLFFVKEDPDDKEVGIPSASLSKKQYSIPEEISRVELVNNCTTTKGFEFRVIYKGHIYHGSFVLDAGVYQKLSEFQAGSLAKQETALALRASPPSFGWGNDDIYYNFAGWDGLGAKPVDTEPGSGRSENTICVRLSRYLHDTSMIHNEAEELDVNIEPGTIAYDRWGSDQEYYSKPQVRYLMMRIKDSNGDDSYLPPKEYQQIHSALEIELPNFQPSGIYDMRDPQIKRGYGRLAELCKCKVYQLSNGRYWLELRRQGCCDQFEFRRIVFGNLDLKNIPPYDEQNLEKSFWTLHRFGYGARNTSQIYEKDYVLPHGEDGPVPFAYLLAGETENAQDAEHYVCPESFGIERAIFTWESKNELVIDLISFERILPVWQGRITFPNDFFAPNFA